ncbi:unnamed protein product [Protopolystoma xenopodis]|uniref:Uncharacterized protein n=1 Tax=Protopolystoma xenopodis TaxID=117903 RepID=A0A3S4ZNS4_9PLAT|nr:unnamed protein product [Protopolystoma xenopodis]
MWTDSSAQLQPTSTVLSSNPNSCAGIGGSIGGAGVTSACGIGTGGSPGLPGVGIGGASGLALAIQSPVVGVVSSNAIGNVGLVSGSTPQVMVGTGTASLILPANSVQSATNLPLVAQQQPPSLQMPPQGPPPGPQMRDLDLACMEAVAALLKGMPLQPEETDRGDLMDAKSHLFAKYFTLFMNLLNDVADDRDMRAELRRNNSALRNVTVLAMSNLLNANIDSGLVHAIGKLTYLCLQTCSRSTDRSSECC